MNNNYMVVSKNDLIKILEDSDANFFMLLATDLETGSSDEVKKISKDTGKDLVNGSTTAIYDDDSMIRNIALYSVEQKDIKHIVQKGTEKRILLPD